MAEGYRVRARAEIVRRFDVDLAELIRDHPEMYAEVEMEGEPEWYRPYFFLQAWVEEEMATDGDFDFDFRWDEKKYAELLRVCPEADLGVEDIGPPCPACPGGKWAHDPGCVLEGIYEARRSA